MEENKKNKLNKLFKAIETCKNCSLCQNRINSVVSRGNINAKIMLIGEAPGKLENQVGQPFVGKSGQQLNELLSKAGFNPEQDIYFCNVVKCRPVKNNKDRKPYKQEIEACIKFLNVQIEIIAPKIIILCGNTAKRIFRINKPMKTVHGTCINNGNIRLFPVYHPRASITDEVKLNDFKKIKNSEVNDEKATI